MECFALGVSVAAVFVECRIGGELGGRFTIPSHIRISPPCVEVLELLGKSDLDFDLTSLEFAAFAAPCPRENVENGCSRP